MKLNSERTSFLFKRRSCSIRLADRKKVLQPRLSIKQRGYPRSCYYLFAKKNMFTKKYIFCHLNRVLGLLDHIGGDGG